MTRVLVVVPMINRDPIRHYCPTCCRVRWSRTLSDPAARPV